MNGVLVSVAAFLGVFGIVYVFLMTRHRERIALIEKGADASIFTDKNQSYYPTLKFGMLFVGIALGILTGNWLDKTYDFSKGVAYLAMVFLFGGISLILNFLIERYLNRSQSVNRH
jgi:divalent metal cation (Fe/Co/Zn/Cd) transporter